MIYYMSAKYEVEFNKVKANGAEERSAVLRKPDTTPACECFLDNRNMAIDA